MFSRIEIFEFHNLILTYINLNDTGHNSFVQRLLSIYKGWRARRILTQIELIMQKNPTLSNYFTLDYRTKERSELKNKFSQISDATFASLANKSSPLMLAVLNNKLPLVTLLLKYGASVGALDAKHKSVLDYIPNGFDPYLTHLMVSRHANRNVRGLIVGCGNGLGACNIDENGTDTWDASHAHIHKYDDFLTVGQESADYKCCFQSLANDDDFVKKYKGKLKSIIFESVDSDILDSITPTGHAVVFDLAYMLLADDGVCIIKIGTYGGHNIELMAQLSGFNFGATWGSTLIVRKNSDAIVIEPWMRNAVEFSLGRKSEFISKLPVRRIYEVKSENSRLIPNVFVRFSNECYNSKNEKILNEYSRCTSLVSNHPDVHPNALIIKDHFSKRELKA